MQAILISAYKNQKYLERLINFFDKKCMVYVHIDYKSDIVPENLNVVCPQNVEIYKKYKINWGSYSHLEAILFLLKRALKNPNINFIHIISGQDMPVKRLEDFNCFEKDNLIYMGHFKVTDIDPKTKTVTVTDLVTGETKTDHYDKLVDTTGSWPVIPPIEGVDGPHVYLCKNYHHAKKLFSAAKDAQRVVVIGGGYIGVELVEAYTRQMAGIPQS